MNLSVRKFNLPIAGLVFVLVFGVAVIFALRQPHVYEATATLQFWREENDTTSTDILQKDVVEFATGEEVIKRVVTRLLQNDQDVFWAAYQPQKTSRELWLRNTLGENYSVRPNRHSLLFSVSYQHGNPQVASRIAQLFADEIIEGEIRKKTDGMVPIIKQLEKKVTTQRQAVQDAERSMDTYRDGYIGDSRDLQNQENFQQLKQQADAADKMLEDSMRALRKAVMSAGGLNLSPCRMIDYATPPAETAYLREPITRNIYRGFWYAVAAGILAGFVVKWRPGIMER